MIDGGVGRSAPPGSREEVPPVVVVVRGASGFARFNSRFVQRADRSGRLDPKVVRRAKRSGRLDPRGSGSWRPLRRSAPVWDGAGDQDRGSAPPAFAPPTAPGRTVVRGPRSPATGRSPARAEQQPRAGERASSTGALARAKRRYRAKMPLLPSVTPAALGTPSREIALSLFAAYSIMKIGLFPGGSI